MSTCYILGNVDQLVEWLLADQLTAQFVEYFYAEDVQGCWCLLHKREDLKPTCFSLSDVCITKFHEKQNHSK